MGNREPIDLIIVLKIVDYLTVRAGRSRKNLIDRAPIVNVAVNHISENAVIDNRSNVWYRATRETTVGDTYVTGQAGGVGPGSFSVGQRNEQVLNQNFGNISLENLADDLGRVRASMRASAQSIEEDLAVSELARAETAARAGDSRKMVAYLARAGRWALEIAESIGAELAAGAIQKSLGM